MTGGEHAWQGGMQGDMCGRGTCMVGKRMCSGDACVVGECVAGGVHATYAPRTLRDTVSQCADGTHPTGMHSCYFMHVVLSYFSYSHQYRSE